MLYLYDLRAVCITIGATQSKRMTAGLNLPSEVGCARVPIMASRQLDGYGTATD